MSIHEVKKLEGIAFSLGTFEWWISNALRWFGDYIDFPTQEASKPFCLAELYCRHLKNLAGVAWDTKIIYQILTISFCGCELKKNRSM